MAQNRCSLTCNVKDANGNVKVSALWDDLTKFFKKDRKQSLLHYFLTKDSNFLRENSDVLEFDVDGEVTISSLKKALERNGEYSDLSNAKTLSYLNEELKAGKYDYSEALDNVLKFNRSHQFKENFMATLKKEEDGKYSIKVVERNSQTEYDLANHVQNKLVTDALRLLLRGRGLSVEFLDNPAYAGMFSTIDATEDAEGLLSLAKVLNGINTSKEVAEIAGHFIVASMKDNPLVERLVEMLTPEVQSALFEKADSEFFRDDFIVSDNSAREAAGILIGKQLIAPFEEAQMGNAFSKFLKRMVPTWKNIKWLLKKVSTFAKKMFGKDSPEDVQLLVQRAKEAASTAAQGFISNPDAASLETALNNPTTFTGGKLSKRLSDAARKNVKAYKDTIDDLKNILSGLRPLLNRNPNLTNRDIFNKLNTLVKAITAEEDPKMSISTFAQAASIEGMTLALVGVTQILENDIADLLDQIQPADRANAYANITQNSRNMRTVNTAIKGISELYLTISNRLDTINAGDKVQWEDADGNQVVSTLREALQKLGEVLIGNEESYQGLQNEDIPVQGLRGIMEKKRRQVFLDAMTDFWGSDYIERNAGIIFQVPSKRTPLLLDTNKIKGYQEKQIKDFVDELEDDISWFDRYLSSAADCGDFVTAVGYKVTRQMNMEADRLAARYYDRVIEFRTQMQEVFGTTDCNMLYEVITDENGHQFKTGNLVSELNHGAWEKARDDFKKQLKEEWKNYLVEYIKKAYQNNKGVKGYTFNPTDQQLGVIYHQFVQPRWEKFHKEHSEPDPTSKGKRYVPNHVKYHNSQWDNLFDTKNPSISEEERKLRERRLVWYNSLMEMKKEMDSLLPKNATVPWRAPQMTGRFGHRYRNLKAQLNNSPAAFGHAMRRSMQDWVSIRPDEAWMFGTNNNFNEIEEDPLENNYYFEKEKLDRLPIFGVNKLQNMEDLSTDLFGTLLQYGSMAATYNAMDRVVDVFELGKDVLKQRKIKSKGGKSEVQLDRGESRAYGRYLKFVEKDIYGLNVTPISLDRGKVIRKIANALSSLGGRILLAGNVHGGIVNTGTGIMEIMKEAVAGENFTVSDLTKAHQMYFDGLLTGADGGIWSTMGYGLLNAQRPVDKNSLWIRHWNILSENRAFLRGQKFDTKAMSLLDNRLWEWFGHSLMLPYSSGDHYMQTIPYYAMGIRTKVYDHDGNAMSLIDAYEIVDGDEIFALDDTSKENPLGRTPKKLKLKEGIFRSAADIKKYDLVMKMLERVDNAYLNHPNARPTAGFDPATTFTQEELDFLREEEFAVPLTFKQLDTLKNALQLKAGSLVYNTTDESAFMDKCRNICNRLHGIYNAEDKVAFQQNFYGNLVTSMRGYALGMINRRFANSKFNVTQGKVVEGSYNTALKVLATAILNSSNADSWKASREALLLLVPFGNFAMFSKKYSERLMADMVRAGFSEHQYYNMRRTGADFLVLEVLWLMNLLAAPGSHFGLSDDEDEDKSKAVDSSDNLLAGLIYYFSQRWFNEQAAFTLPSGMTREGNSLLDWYPAGLSGAKGMYEILELLAKTAWDNIDGNPDLENSDLYYQSTKEGKYEAGDAKAKVRFERLCPYFRSWYTFTHPYDAAASYEYGRRVRGK